ncbi:MAG: hypothetical protein AAGA58_09830 [Verrucomicrobiota bacterium]
MRIFVYLLVSAPLFAVANPFVTDRIEGNVWVRSVVHDDGSHTVSKRDLKGKNQIIMERRNPSGVVVSKTILDLDGAGNHRRGQVFDGFGRLRFVSDFSYNASGQLQEEQIRDANNKLVTKIVYKYDSKGKARPYAVDYSSGVASSPRAVAEKSEWSTTSSMGYTGVPTNNPKPATSSDSPIQRRSKLFNSSGGTAQPSNSGSRRKLLPWRNR